MSRVSRVGEHGVSMERGRDGELEAETLEKRRGEETWGAWGRGGARRGRLAGVIRITSGMGAAREGKTADVCGIYAPWIGWKLAGLAVLRSRARSSDAKAFFWNAAASSGWRSREGPRLAPLRRLLFVLEEGIVGEREGWRDGGKLEKIIS